MIITRVYYCEIVFMVLNTIPIKMQEYVTFAFAHMLSVISRNVLIQQVMREKRYIMKSVQK